MREAEIVEAAFAVFARDGFAAAKVEAVAELAKVSKGTVYVYFETKEALFEAVVRNYILASIEEVAAGARDAGLNHEDRLRAVLSGAYRLFAGSDIRKIIVMLIGEGGRFPQLLDFYHDVVLVRAREILARVVRDGVEAGAFRDAPVDKFPHLVMGPGMMGAIWTHHFNRLSPVDLDELYEAHVDLLLNGLRPRPSPSSR
ncbi:MAG: TetR/AcrR family transcriptional regulator [Parvularculaceae bacterium]